MGQLGSPGCFKSLGSWTATGYFLLALLSDGFEFGSQRYRQRRPQNITMVGTTHLFAGFGLGFLTLVDGRAFNSTDKPTVTVKNGTYYGIHNPDFNQDFFLGMPFAKVGAPCLD